MERGLMGVLATAPHGVALDGWTLDGSGHELLLVRRGRRSGIHTIIAVHSTALGPALGGCRMWHYPSLSAAVEDALRLSHAMTLKAAVAQLALGGGKSVVYLPHDLELTHEGREAVLRDFADALNLLEGKYITAEDVGTTSADMATLSAYSPHVVGLPTRLGGSGDPGEFTAAGVFAAMRACCEHCFGAPDLAGRSVAVVGLGHVGEPLARRLARAGARLIVSDIDPARQSLAGELGASWREPHEALVARVDVLAPCALGGILDEALVEELDCRIICGSANNQLSHDELAEALAAREILYAPDFVVNAGGLINVAVELAGYERARAARGAAEIERVIAGVLSHAEAARLTPLAAAVELAYRRLDAAAASQAVRPSPTS
jgi:leucine dehydrogenase